MSLALVRYQPLPTRTLGRRLTLLAELEAEAAELDREREETGSKIREFEQRYRPAVGDRYLELEDLKDQIQKAWRLVQQARNGQDLAPEPTPQAEDAPHEAFKPEHNLRSLFRELARRIHPDLANTAVERKRRHEFMSEATYAYRAGDERRLQWLFEHWEATLDSRAESDRDKTNQQIAWVRDRIRELNSTIASLNASSIAQIMRESDEARMQGRNWVIELRNRVVDQLNEARLELRRVSEAVKELDEKTARIVRLRAGLE